MNSTKYKNMSSYLKLVGYLLFFVCYFIQRESLAQTLAKKFTVTYSVTYRDEVDLTPYGILKNQIIYESSVLPLQTSDDLISDHELKKFSDSIPQSAAPIVIDVERWQLEGDDSIHRDENVSKLIFLLKRLREFNPGRKFGYYGVIPHTVFW